MQARERKPPLLEDQFVKEVTILSEPHPTPGAKEGKMPQLIWKSPKLALL